MSKSDGLGHKIMTTEPRAKTLKMMIDKYSPEVPLTGINKQWLEPPLLIIHDCEKEAGHTTFVRTQLKLTDFRDTFDNYSLHGRVDLYYAPNDSHNNHGFIARIVKVGVDKSVSTTKKYSDCVIAPLDPYRFSFWLCPEYTDTAEHTSGDYQYIRDDGSFIKASEYEADKSIAKYVVLSKTNKGSLPEEYGDAMDYRFCMCERNVVADSTPSQPFITKTINYLTGISTGSHQIWFTSETTTVCIPKPVE